MNYNQERYVSPSDNSNQQKVYHNQNQNNDQNPFTAISNDANMAAGIGFNNHANPQYDNPNTNRFKFNDYDHSALVFSSSPSIRGRFIAKVYTIMSCQILITFLMILASYKYEGFRDLIVNIQAMRYTGFTWVCFAFALIIEIAIFCCRNVARQVPLNYILLFAFTFCFGTLVAAPCVICFYYLSNGVQLVIAAAAITFGVTALLTAYAWHTKEDYTIYGHICFTISITLFFFCIAGIFIRDIWFQLFICCISVCVYAGYVVIDTQLIIGNQSNSISIDDYIIAAMLLYIDLVILFLRILEILVIIFGKN